MCRAVGIIEENEMEAAGKGDSKGGGGRGMCLHSEMVMIGSICVCGWDG